MEFEVSVEVTVSVLVLPAELDVVVMEFVVSVAEAEMTVAGGIVVFVLPVVVGADSPSFDVVNCVLAVELLSTPLEKIRMQARTAMR